MDARGDQRTASRADGLVIDLRDETVAADRAERARHRAPTAAARHRRAHLSRRRWVAVLVLLGLGSLAAAWVLAVPAFGDPDESAHLVHSVAVASGHVTGPSAATDPGTVGRGTQYARYLTVPRRFAISDEQPCWVTAPDQPADCGPGTTAHGGTTAASYVAGYPPPLYGALGLAERTTGTPTAAVYAGRALSAVVCLALLGAAYLLLPGRRQRVLWLAAVAPVTVFAATTASTNGMEIAGATLLLAAGLFADRSGATVGWVVGATVLAVARTLGPLYLLLDLLVIAVATGRRPWPSWRAAVLPAAAAVAALGWSATAYQWSTATTPHSVVAAAKQALHVPKLMFDRFGWQDVLVPHGLAYVGVLGLLLLVGAALAAADRRGRIAILVAAVVGYVATVGSTYAVMSSSGGISSRYSMAVLVAVPLVAAHAVRDRAPNRWLLGGGAALVLVGQLVAFGTVVRRYAVGADGSLLLRHPGWTPPGGLVLTVALGVVGVLALAAVVVSRVGLREVPPAAV